MRVGIAGVGFMGSTHAAGWAETEAELVGFAAETVQEAEQIAAQYNVQIFPDFVTLLSNVDIVDICTPTHLHYEMVMQAAEAGKHIICEKPLALTTDQAREAVSYCRKMGVRLFVAHVVRFFPETALAKDVVAKGQIGKPGVIRLTRGSYRPKRPVGNWFLDEDKSGGILMDLMIHDYDYARWIAGEVESVFAKKISTAFPEAPVDYGLVILKHRSGTLTHVAGAWAYPPPTFRTHIEIAGDAGLLEFDSDNTAPVRELKIKTDDEDAPDVAGISITLSENPYTLQIKEFYGAIRDDSQARVTAADGLAAVQIAEAALQSAATGKAVKLEALPEVES